MLFSSANIKCSCKHLFILSLSEKIFTKNIHLKQVKYFHPNFHNIVYSNIFQKQSPFVTSVNITLCEQVPEPIYFIHRHIINLFLKQTSVHGIYMESLWDSVKSLPQRANIGP